jgi:RimJ/RimL family protein N-acetyltransferase
MDYENKSIYLKRPSFYELSLTKDLLSDKLTMSFNDKWGGTVDFDSSKWNNFFNEYINDDNENEYFHIYNKENIFVGEISTRFDKQFDSFVLNIKVKYEFRGNNYADDALEVFLEYLFNEKKINMIVDNVAFDNLGAIHFLKKNGFSEVSKNNDVVILELKAEDYR